MGFGSCWLKWMESLIFNSYMFMLVNGIPTEDFKCSRGLKQGDSLSPFLFFIVAEVLTGLVRNASENGLYSGFNCGQGVEMDILQFANDTLFIGEGNWSNLKDTKSILRGYELVSRLKVKFIKSMVIGINFSTNFSLAGANFLNCRIEESSFSFLGISIGVNLRKFSMWEPLLEKVKSRLTQRKVRFLTLGGRVTLLKSVLISLTIFWFSFYKVSVVV